ncbi:MAG: F0F1 ATP synthase subunit A [Jiangellaceae bacterium]
MSAWMLSAEVSEEFHAPGPADFEFPPIFGADGFLTKPMLIIIVGTALIALLFYLATRRAGVVPGKLQFAGEGVYGFVRNQIAADAIGREGIKYVPYLATLFVFIAVLNVAGIVPFAQFPATSRIAIPLFLAVISWVIFNYVGIKRQGFGGYFKNMLFPPGVPKAIYPLLSPIEFMSTVVFRPITLTLRLTFNMFAGHLVLLLCILGGEFLLFEVQGVIGFAAGGVAMLFGIVMTFFEGFIQLLQAYVFTLLSAVYIGGALTHEH